MPDSLNLQLWTITELLPAVDETGRVVFADAQMGLDELRLRIKATMLDLEACRRENVMLRKSLEEAGQ